MRIHECNIDYSPPSSPFFLNPVLSPHHRAHDVDQREIDSHLLGLGAHGLGVTQKCDVGEAALSHLGGGLQHATVLGLHSGGGGEGEKGRGTMVSSGPGLRRGGGGTGGTPGLMPCVQ